MDHIHIDAVELEFHNKLSTVGTNRFNQQKIGLHVA